ncbi:hypothetical protein B7494_g5830 [Chlorociboria aeruginascens]|nr:hypothetical protein B7494_g5830 [Chlorociboria aeruginascens]
MRGPVMNNHIMNNHNMSNHIMSNPVMSNDMSNPVMRGPVMNNHIMSNPVMSNPVMSNDMSNPVMRGPVMGNHIMNNHNMSNSITGSPVMSNNTMSNPTNPAHVVNFVDQSSDSGMNNFFNEGIGGCNSNKLPFVPASTTKNDASDNPIVQTNDTSLDKLSTPEEPGGFDVNELPSTGVDDWLSDMIKENFGMEVHEFHQKYCSEKSTEQVEKPSFVELQSSPADLPEKSLQDIIPRNSVTSASSVVLAEENLQVSVDTTGIYDLEPVPPLFGSDHLVLSEVSVETMGNATSDFTSNSITPCENKTIQEVIAKPTERPNTIFGSPVTISEDGSEPSTWDWEPTAETLERYKWVETLTAKDIGVDERWLHEYIHTLPWPEYESPAKPKEPEIKPKASS